MITERTQIDGPNETRPQRDVTDLDSTRREFKGGLADSGEGKLRFFYIPTNAVHKIVRAAFTGNIEKQWMLEYSDGTTWEFNGSITGWKNGPFDVDSDVNVEVTIKISGDITEHVL